MKTLKNHFLILISVFCIIPTLLTAQTATEPTGTGSSENPYQVATLDNLYWITQNSTQWNKNYIQTSDINASSTSSWDSGNGYDPIGSFSGEYNGNGYKISGLYIDRPSENYVGLFGRVNQGAEVYNLTLEDAQINGALYTGILAGEAEESGTKINNVSVSGQVSGSSYTGGVTGYLYDEATIDSSSSSATVEGVFYVGGLVGRGNILAKISNSYATGDVIGSQGGTGGFIGTLETVSEILNSYSTGNVQGRLTGSIQFNVGGFVGSTNRSSINYSFSTGNVNASRNERVGGFIGYNFRGNISDSFGAGDAVGYRYVGGFAGVHQDSSITNSYSIGNPSTIIGTPGGFIGDNSSGNLSNTYWNITTSGLTDDIGLSNNSESSNGLTSSEMKEQSNFTGFNFVTDWSIEENATFPFLKIFGGKIRLGGAIITGSEGWRMYGSPFVDATFSSFSNGIWTQGFTGASSTTGNTSIRVWDEKNQIWSTPDSLGKAILKGQGFIMYVYEDDDFTASGIQGGFPKSLVEKGSVNALSKTLNLSYTNGSNPAIDGYNLISNPSSSTIDLGKLTLNNVSNTFSIWDPVDNHYDTYQVGIGGTNGGTQYLAPFQGFWARATGATSSITVDSTDVNTSVSGSLYKPNNDLYSAVVRVKQETGFSDEIRLVFSSDQETNKFDAYDLPPLSNEYLNATITKNETNYSIGEFNYNMEKIEVPFNIYSKGGSSNGITLAMSQNNLPDNWDFKLVNKSTSDVYDLINSSNEIKLTLNSSDSSGMKSSSLYFEINTQTAVSNESNIELPQEIELFQNYPNPFNPNTNIAFTLPKSANVTLEVFDLLGRRVDILINNENKSAGSYSINFDASSLSSGMYIYRLSTGSSVLIKKLTLIK